MEIERILDEEEVGDYVCEVTGCSNNANYYVSAFTGSFGFICKSCFEKIAAKMQLYVAEDGNLTLSGTAEQLDALADGLKMKAKLGDNFSFTYTGIEGRKLEVRLM
jgi:hypothetical protein